ncbi:hypothetical protein BV898_12336 [Hypsibius exemplaris]|uniref:Uncharacterized protein n=1 Tax=Hypsibius exemplaris TaxID=2072580 RepID=A0A1W0WE40_HYPEX|nr:hypothetical protein BV898_12336 [Hypsibius exemplaris]
MRSTGRDKEQSVIEQVGSVNAEVTVPTARARLNVTATFEGETYLRHGREGCGLALPAPLRRHLAIAEHGVSMKHHHFSASAICGILTEGSDQSMAGDYCRPTEVQSRSGPPLQRTRLRTLSGGKVICRPSRHSSRRPWIWWDRQLLVICSVFRRTLKTLFAKRAKAIGFKSPNVAGPCKKRSDKTASEAEERTIWRQYMALVEEYYDRLEVDAKGGLRDGSF